MTKILKNLLFLIFLFFIETNFAFCDTFKDAESMLMRAETTAIKEAKYDYLHKARQLYLEVCEENPIHIGALLGLSKVNQMLGDRNEAKLYVLKAYNLDSTNPHLIREMGDFYFAFQEYSTAIEYYKLSLASGNLRDFQTNLKTAQCYEKLGDIEQSELYYKISGKVNPSSKIAANKINSIESSHRPDNSEELDKLKYKYLFKERPVPQEEKENTEINEIIEQLNSGLE